MPLTKETRGQANFYFIDDQVTDENRYAFFLKHQQKLPYDFYLKGDINYVSDNDFTLVILTKTFRKGRRLIRGA